MYALGTPTFNPLCESQFVFMDRDNIKSPTGLNCKPCCKPSYPGSPCICDYYFCFCMQYPCFVISDTGHQVGGTPGSYYIPAGRCCFTQPDVEEPHACQLIGTAVSTPWNGISDSVSSYNYPVVADPRFPSGVISLKMPGLSITPGGSGGSTSFSIAYRVATSCDSDYMVLSPYHVYDWDPVFGYIFPPYYEGFSGPYFVTAMPYHCNTGHVYTSDAEAQIKVKKKKTAFAGSYISVCSFDVYASPTYNDACGCWIAPGDAP